MNAKELEDLFRLFKHMTMNQSETRDHYHHEQMRSENEYFIKFSSWVKQSYPDVWEAWQAVHDIENSARVDVPLARYR